MTLNKSPPLTGPVNRGSFFLSTAGGKLLSLKIRRSERSPDEQRDIRGGVPTYRCAHAGYDISPRFNAKTRRAFLRTGFGRDE
jgi:hypothetical protein